MKIKLYSIVLAAMALSSCSHYYAPVLYRNSAFYQPKPMSTDSAKSATYVSGGIGESASSNLNDNIFMGQLSIDQAYTFSNLNLAYGVFGMAGAYQNTSLQTTDPNYFDSKSFGIVGGKFSANIFAPMGNVDLRIIGIELLYSREFGDYANFRSSTKSGPDIYVDGNNTVFSGALTSEIAWKGKRDPAIKYALRGYLGTTFGYHQFVNGTNNYTDGDINNKFNIGAAFYMQVKNYCITFERQNLVNATLRFGYSF